VTIHERVRRPFAVLAWTVALVGAALFAWSIGNYPLYLNAPVAVLLVATILAENFALEMPGFSVSVTYPMLFAMALIGGPTAALLAALLISVNLPDVRARLSPSVYAFNAGSILTTNGLAAWSYVLLGGRVLSTASGAVVGLDASDFPEIILPLFAMVTIGALGNFLLLVLGYSLKQAEPMRSVLASLGWLPPAQVALAGVGILIAQVLAASIVALPLFVFPLLVARQFYQRFMALQDAYTDTLRSLVTGLERKDPYTRGHSERVAQYSVQLARHVGMDERALREIETAALLHDLGKLSIGGAILRKQGGLDENEWAAMKRHPEIGASMIERIPHLRALAPAVAAHHERLDGSGYPGGLVGTQIPNMSLVLAIADSFDAMTTDRPYRPGLDSGAAFEELDSCSGRLYDADLVKVFVESFESRPLDGKSDVSIGRAASESGPS
jgi:hypothetical protein